MTAFPTTLGQLAQRLGGSVEGDAGVTVSGLAPVATAGPDEVTFAGDARHAAALAATQAAAAIVARDAPPAGLPLIRVEDVNRAVADVLEMIGDGEDLPPAGVHPTAVVAADAEIAPGAAVGPLAVVGAGAKVGPEAVLCAHVVVGSGAEVGARTVLLAGTVVVRRCRIGRSCRIGPSAVIGGSGFGYYFDGESHRRFAHAGTVEIGDGVDVGACSCVDRGKFGATRIGDGTKIDNLVQVAHNVQIGRGCLLAALAGVSGSAELGDYVVFGGNVGVRDNIRIGAGVRVGACSCIAHDVPDGARVAGVPAIDGGVWLRSVRQFARLAEMNARIRALEKKVAAFGPSADH
jgi:UDP-3-O-[3-hydroxymyristoyl] glucosamine N-acyltransferase